MEIADILYIRYNKWYYNSEERLKKFLNKIREETGFFDTPIILYPENRKNISAKEKEFLHTLITGFHPKRVLLYSVEQTDLDRLRSE